MASDMFVNGCAITAEKPQGVVIELITRDAEGNIWRLEKNDCLLIMEYSGIAFRTHNKIMYTLDVYPMLYAIMPELLPEVKYKVNAVGW